jgi:hypothetical protein
VGKIVSIKPKQAKKATANRRLADQEQRDDQRMMFLRAIGHLKATPGFGHIANMLQPVISALEARAESLASYKRVTPRAKPQPTSGEPVTPLSRAENPELPLP